MSASLSRWRLPRVVALAAGLGLVAAACSTDGRSMRPPSPDQTATILVTTTIGPIVSGPASVDGPIISIPWASGGAIPAQFTCKGDNVNPAIGWSALPEGTAEVAIAMTDLDANDFVHWVVAGLDPSVGQVPQNGVPEDAVQSLNDFGSPGYKGPCPPSGTHSYAITVYALREPSGLTDGGNPHDAIAKLELYPSPPTWCSARSAAPEPMADGELHSASFTELSTTTLYEVLRLRSEVFVVEQACAYGDLDGRDREPATRHLWVEDGGTVVAYLRVLDDGDGRRIGRVVPASTHRRHGLAARLVEAALVSTTGPVTLHAAVLPQGLVRGVRLRRRWPGVPRRRHPARPDAPRPLTPLFSRGFTGLLPVDPVSRDGDVVEVVGELLDGRAPAGGHVLDGRLGGPGSPSASGGRR